MPQLDNKVAIITGAAGGIGSATARLFAERGASVVLADVDFEAARAVAALLDGAGMAAHLDLAHRESIESMIRATLGRFGRIDVLHNNAADLSPANTAGDQDVESMDIGAWDRTFQVNVRGTMLCCKHVLPHMVSQKSGSIINTASNLGMQGNVGQAGYAASKAAVIQLTRSIATSHGRFGIRCNTVSPGLVLTPSARKNLPARILEAVADETLTPYLGAAEDIAHAVAFLASDEARYVTGHNLVVDGGTVAHVPGFARLREFCAPR